MGRLENKVAIVTGAVMGIGWGIAQVFVEEGSAVCMFDISDKVFDSAQELEEKGYTAKAYKVDVSNFDAVRKAVDEVVETFEKIDILVNNAGIAHLAPFLETSDELRDQHFQVNINGVWNCSKAVLPHMVERRYGKVINLSSVVGPFVADPCEVAYATTKSAIWGFTRAAAMEFVEHNITVNMICPGVIRTPLLESGAADLNPGNPQELIDAVVASIPMKRLGKIEEAGYLATFLASDESSYITGQPFVIDGGGTLPHTNVA
jgi:NAD(P)-dependent dehydrogenase (short-subunit alcohol dehydrogenase family)